ncbi:heme A synthase [Wenzhouxiangella sp. XN79A]|uniref:COX15/CtaA family protein n=1 Tax=Wenzhouxiangella sp. XN79A TaxID=2724193 RepID=UPI00144A63AB|nr:COX15/CtaA family protein [Wenzhouxiangella sp. XN79A]NKI36045.1 heme A synthase [Wenzhouxiangella sp. XN79A]
MKNFRRLAWIATGLCLFVIVAGAWVRLTHAGLGCPDWPGCYGMVTWPKTPEHIETATRVFSEHTVTRAVDSGKAFREMAHRYVASLLGLLIVIMAVMAWRNRRDPAQPVGLPMSILALVIFQGILGMWTVTLLLKPAIVTAHLAGGMATGALLFWLALKTTSTSKPSLPARALHPLVWLGFAVVVVQILLGGWVSTNYAALACPDFPTCTGAWWPQTDFGEGFRIWRGVGVDYEGGVLDQSARVAIHMAHRIWAIAVVGVLAWLFSRLVRVEELRGLAFGMIGVLTVQVLIGIYNIVGGLPLANAVAHNGIAAILLFTMVALLHRTRRSVA